MQDILHHLNSPKLHQNAVLLKQRVYKVMQDFLHPQEATVEA